MTTQPMPKALLLDLDGTLIDTEPAHRQSWLDVIIARTGVNLHRDALPWTPGLSFRAAIEMHALLCELDSSCSLDTWLQRKRTAYVQHVANGLPQIAPVIAAAHDLHNHGVRLVVVTNSRPVELAATLRVLTISHRLEQAVCLTDDLRPKPHPDLYQRALDLLGISAGEALAVEDSLTGQHGALAAGVRCAMVGGRTGIAFADITAGKLLRAFSDELVATVAQP